MKKIETLQQLKDERLLIRRRIQKLEEQIENDFNEIKEDLRPINLAAKAVKNMLSSEDHGLMSESIGLTVDALIKKLVFRKSGFLTKTILAFVIKNYARNLVSKNSEEVLSWVQSLLSKLKSRHHHNGQHYDKSTAGFEMEM